MNKIQTFSNIEFGEIRTIEVDDKPYFVGSDIARILGYKEPHKAISRHCKGGMKRTILTNGGEQELTVIPEGDVYRLIIKSKLPSAEKFESWVMDEVLPSIRKHGIYATEDTIDAMLNNPDTMIRVLTELKEEREQRIKLEKENASLLPDANMARDIIKYSGLYTLKEVADLVESGRTELCTLLRIGKVLSKQTGYNLPLNKYIKQGYFKIKIKEKYNTPVTLVTARGLKFIYRLIKKFDMTDEFDVDTLLETAKDMEDCA